MAGHFGGPPQGESKTKVVALMFVALTLLVVFGALIFISKSSRQIVQVGNQSVEEDQRYAKVLFPIRKIQKNEQLDRSMFREESIARDALPEGVVTDIPSINGKYAKVEIIPKEGEPLLAEYMTHVRPALVTGLIKVGYRAVTIRVDNTTGVEGWARPGSRVDVLWTTRVNNEGRVITLVKNAEVLSMDRNFTDSSVSNVAPTSVTLQVLDEDSKKITLASTSGTLNLVLRGDDNDTVDEQNSDNPITIEDISGNRRPPPPVVNLPAKPACEGSVVVEGKKYCIVNGRMVAVDE